MIVYKITNILNKKGYVGITKNSLDWRWKKHLDSLSRGHDQFLYRAIRKYGIDNFKIKKISSASSIEELNLLEKLYIKKYKTYFKHHGYNMTLGGDLSGYCPSEKTRKKLSKAATGKVQSQQTRDKRSKSIKKSWQNKEIRKKRIEAMTIAQNDPENKRKASKTKRRIWKNPILIEKHSFIMKAVRARPEVKEKYKKTHCLRGHKLSGKNLRINKQGRKSCKTCTRIKKIEWRSNNREKENEQQKRRRKK
jgi:group I intron endonuclease